MFQDMIQTDKFNKQNLRHIHVRVCKSDTPILSNRLWKGSYLLIWTSFKRYCSSETDCNAQSKFLHTDVIPKGIQVILLLFQNRRQHYQRGFWLKKNSKTKARLPVITTVDVSTLRMKGCLSSQKTPVTSSNEVSDPNTEKELLTLLPPHQVRPQPITPLQSFNCLPLCLPNSQ